MLSRGPNLKYGDYWPCSPSSSVRDDACNGVNAWISVGIARTPPTRRTRKVELPSDDDILGKRLLIRSVQFFLLADHDRVPQLARRAFAPSALVICTTDGDLDSDEMV